MLVKALLTCLLVASASAAPGLLHEEPHHTHEVLDNIHNTPHCAYTCIFHEELPGQWASECLSKKGKEYGACLCRANAYQYMLDQCVAMSCEAKNAWKAAREMNEKSCKHYGVSKKEMYELEKIG